MLFPAHSMLWFAELALYPRFRLVYSEFMQPNGDKAPTDQAENAQAPGRPTDRATTTRLGQRHTVQEAAQLLGTTVEGVRSRIKRGTLDSMRVSGHVYVLLDSDQIDQAPTSPDQSSAQSKGQNTDQTHPGDVGSVGAHHPLLRAKDETIGELRDRVEHLQRELEVRNEELRRKDHLLAATLERIPELEAAPEPRDATKTTSEDAARVEVPPEPQEPSERRSWWRRFFGV